MIHNLLETIGVFGNAVAVAGLIAAVCSVLGVFVVLKRVVFIGITLSEVAACGVAAAMMCNVHPLIGAGILTMAVVALLAYPYELLRIPRDAVLGVVFVLAASLSILLVAKSGFGLEKVKALLYGNLLFASGRDLIIVSCVTIPVFAYLMLFMRPTLYSFLDREAAKVMGIRVALWELLFFFALGLSVSAASKVAGALLVFCYLVVAPSAALLLSKRLWLVLPFSAAIAVASTFVGMLWSYASDLPTNQTVAVVSCCVFGVVMALTAGGGLARGLKGSPARRPLVIGLIAVAALAVAVALYFLAAISGDGTYRRADERGLRVTETSPSQPSTQALVERSARCNEIEEIESLLRQAAADEARSAIICRALEVDLRAGVRLALDFLKKDPPCFFRQDVIERLNAILAGEARFDPAQPFASQANQEAAAKILEKIGEKKAAQPQP